MDLANPVSPARTGVFVPTPLPSVSTEDPALSLGLNKAVMWSYPIFNRQGGQTYLYVVDVRNGLYVLRYTGPRSAAVDALSFLEGNSNLGDAPALDGVTTPPPGGGGGITFGAVVPASLHMDSVASVGEAERAGEFGGVIDGPVLSKSAPAGPVKIQETSRFGNPGFPANFLLAYFTLDEPVRIQGTPTVDVWVSAPSAPGVTTVPLSVELFVDGSPKLGQPSGTAWDPISLPVDVGPVPTKVTLTLPTVNLTALDSLVLQFGVEAPTAGPQPKNAVVLYGSAGFDSTLSGPMAFAI